MFDNHVLVQYLQSVGAVQTIATCDCFSLLFVRDIHLRL